MESFTAKHGTTFYYNVDLRGEVMIARAIGRNAEESPMRVGRTGDDRVGLSCPAEDLLEFMSHITNIPSWDPDHVPHDKETSEVMVAHVQSCTTCSGGLTHCEEYWKMLLDRARDREKRLIQ